MGRLNKQVDFENYENYCAFLYNDCYFERSLCPGLVRKNGPDDENDLKKKRIVRLDQIINHKIDEYVYLPVPKPRIYELLLVSSADSDRYSSPLRRYAFVNGKQLFSEIDDFVILAADYLFNRHLSVEERVERRYFCQSQPHSTYSRAECISGLMDPLTAITYEGFVFAYVTTLWQGGLKSLLGVDYDILLEFVIRCKKMTKISKAYGISNTSLLGALVCGPGFKSIPVWGDFCCWSDVVSNDSLIEIDRPLGCNELLRIGRMTLGLWNSVPEVLVELNSEKYFAKGKALIFSGNRMMMHASGSTNFTSYVDRLQEDLTADQLFDRVRFSDERKVGGVASKIIDTRDFEIAVKNVAIVLAVLDPRAKYAVVLPTEISVGIIVSTGFFF
ncbi:hypothetical protein HK100_011994 [Physocladia obscura]|uniref:Uncharacterized protein n=1 Tax=Physocladia obscura TaxID=109957 RepID=A0AAD5T1W1_9FUNG|nr:hypothetical protein HK100_011994 [Physocladia obscura]